MDCNKPIYSPRVWDSINESYNNITNCYSYAMNRIETGKDEKLQPGELSTGKYQNYECNEISNKKMDDFNGIKKSSKYGHVPCGYYKIALVLDTQGTPDYHFYRQDINGKWSHKLGDNKVSNLDGSGNILIDLDFNDHNYDKVNNDEHVYNIICGYYIVPYKDIKYY